MNKKIIYIMMVISVFGIMMCGCGKKDVQTTANGGNSDVINEVEYNPDINTFADDIAGDKGNIDEISIPELTVKFCIPEGFAKDYEELYVGETDFYSTDYITEDMVLASVTVFNYSDMGTTALSVLKDDINYENSEIKEEKINGVTFHYAVRYAETEEGQDTVWTFVCDLGDGWIYQARVSGLDMNRKIDFDEVKDFMNISKK